MGIFGRYGMFSRITKYNFEKIHSLGRKKIWFHVASAGELEQTYPIIEAIKNRFSESFVIVTFFSPSGYNFYKKKKFKNIDIAEYSPIDTPIDVVRFLNIVKPDLLVLSKYDIWPNMIWLSWITRVKVIMINGSLQTFSKRFTSVAKFFYKSLYSCFAFIGTITEDDAIRFRIAVNGKTNVHTVGDTKYDRVVSRRNSTKLDINLEKYLKNNVFIAASVWEEDEKLLFPALKQLFNNYNETFTAVIVPHEPGTKILERWEAFFKKNMINFSKLSHLTSDTTLSAILVDRVGMLAELYKYSHISYIGGAFSKGGVHNILEPAIYGNPTAFGPKYHNSYEAAMFVGNNLSQVLKSDTDLYLFVEKFLQDKGYLHNKGEEHIKKVKELSGATTRYLEHINEIINQL